MSRLLGGDDGSDCFRNSISVGCFSLLGTRASWATFGRVETRFGWLMSIGWFRFFDHFLNDAIVAVRQSMSALISVEGRREAPDVDTLPYAPFMPVRLPRKDFNVFFAETVQSPPT